VGDKDELTTIHGNGKITKQGLLDAQALLRSTDWPLEALRSDELNYLDDRSCPRNPNPLWYEGDKKEVQRKELLKERVSVEVQDDASVMGMQHQGGHGDGESSPYQLQQFSKWCAAGDGDAGGECLRNHGGTSSSACNTDIMYKVIDRLLYVNVPELFKLRQPQDCEQLRPIERWADDIKDEFNGQDPWTDVRKALVEEKSTTASPKRVRRTCRKETPRQPDISMLSEDEHSGETAVAPTTWQYEVLDVADGGVGFAELLAEQEKHALCNVATEVVSGTGEE